MKVTARKGTKCPKENNHRDYISDSIPVEVPERSYYRRLVADGSLVEQAQESKFNLRDAQPEGQPPESPFVKGEFIVESGLSPNKKGGKK